MKNLRLLLLLASTLCASTVFGQLKINKTTKLEKITRVGVLGVTRLQLSRSITESDTLYNVMYVNNAFTHTVQYEHFSLAASKTDMLLLEETMLNTLNGESDEHLSIELGDKKYLISKSNIMGFPHLTLFHSKYDFINLAKKEITKLFESFHKE